MICISQMGGHEKWSLRGLFETKEIANIIGVKEIPHVGHHRIILLPFPSTSMFSK